MRYLSLIVLCACLAACHHPTPPQKQYKTELDFNNMYIQDTLLPAAKERAGERSAYATELFLRAIDLFQHNDSSKGHFELRSAVRLQPCATFCYEYASYMLAARNPEPAICFYSVAAAMGYSPAYNVLYGQARAWALLKNEDKADSLLDAAIRAGYSNVANIYSDPEMAFIRSDKARLDTLIKHARNSIKDPQLLTWHLFLQEFKPIQLPLTLNADHRETLTDHFIAYDYDQFVPEMKENDTSRNTRQVFHYLGWVKKTDSVNTVLYAAENPIWQGYPESPAAYFLASFNAQGKLIDKLAIGDRPQLDGVVATAIIQPQGIIEITQFKQRYRDNPNGKTWGGHEVAERKELSKRTYMITASGRFIMGK